ncbi:MAG: RNB domain-containing ribonuclease, partial [Actinomycetota bacterium]
MGRGGRAGGTLVAQLVGAGRGAAARPAFEPGPDIALSRASRGGADVGDLVTVALRGGGARVVAVHGPARSPRAAMRALLAGEGLGRAFPAAALEEAEAGGAVDGSRDAGRRDMRDQLVITIDPEGAKDHDDAIAVAEEGDAIRLWVHIADVSRFVPAGGATDREAARRGTSVYVPGTVDPMLPPRLSNDLCSLRPGVDRLAVTAEMLFGPDGEMRESRFYRATIRSEGRLTYPEVDAHLAGASLGDAALEGSLAVARRLAGWLRARRMRRGALDIATAEPVVTFDGDRVARISLEHQTESHQIIEECMIAANEAVARYLIAHRRATVFRFHEDPEEARIERLYDQLQELGLVVPALPDPPLTPQQCRDAAGAASHAVARHLAQDTRGAKAFPGLVLRALRQAYYAVDHVGHSGLASAAYLHFTSPIRRYPDLMVHRALLDALGVGDPAPDQAWLSEAAFHSSETERAAADVERTADRICAAYHLRDVVAQRGWDTVYEGEVTGVIEVGAFVTFEGVFEGFLPARDIPGDRYFIDPWQTALVGEETGRKLRLGDPVEVRVSDITPLRG